MNKLRVLIPIGCRSDEGLSAPLIRRLRETDWCDCTTIPLSPANYIESYKIIEKHLSLCNYDLVIATGDRIEMEAFAKCAFLHNIPIAHFYAGVIDYSFVLFDDILRHSITLMADIAFCEDRDSAYRVMKLWDSIGKYKGKIKDPNSLDKNEIYNVGISHMDDLELDESLVPRYRYCDKCEILLDCKEPNGIGCIEPYDLVVYNPPTHASELGNKTLITKELDLLIKLLKLNKKTFFVDPNPDPYNHFIMEYIYSKNYHDFEFKYKLPRPKFLGFLKNCSRYITNSSNINYEARPLGLKDEQIIQVGLRNKGRSTPKQLELGASQKIVKILKEWWENEDNS